MDSKTENRPRPRFARVEHIGSLVRPPSLLDPRLPEMEPEERDAITDTAIRRVVAIQRDAGLPVVTDGAFHCPRGHRDVLAGFSGIETGHDDALSITDRIVFENSHPIVAEARAIVAVAGDDAKVGLPGPDALLALASHHRPYREAEVLEDDLVRVWTDLIASVAEAGCRRVQLDIFPEMPRPATLERHAALLSRIAARTPPSIALGVYFGAVPEGRDGDAMVDLVSSALAGHVILLDCRSEARRDAVARNLASSAKLVAGLVSAADPALERADDLARALDALGARIDGERLALSPHAGFAPEADRPTMSEDQQRRKLDLVIRVADRLFGSL